MSSPPTSDLERLGGLDGLERIVRRFVDRVFDDVMIGFHFRDADRSTIAALETQFAARHLGGRVEYQGRPLAEAHAPHPITGGQFHRRMQILREVLAEAGAPEDLIERWVQHNLRLRGQVTGDPGSACHQQGKQG